MNRTILKQQNMRSFLYALGAVFIFSLSAEGQSTHQEAKALLNEASEKMKSYNKIKIDFEYNLENTRVDPPVTQKQSGTIAIKGNNYHLSLNNLEQIRDGNKLYNILRADEEVQVTTYDPEEDQGLTPAKILNLFDKGYSYKLGGTETVNGKKVRYVILKPVASEDIDKIMIGIDDKTKHVHSMKQWGTNGTITTFLVKNFEVNPDISNGHFTFSEADYPGYYIAR